MNARRVKNAGVLGMSVLVLAASVGHESSEAFLFPKIIAIAMCVLAVASLVLEWPQAEPASDEDAPEASIPWAMLGPALGVIVIYMLIAERLGFFVSSVLVFVAIAVVYYPQRRWTDIFRRCLVVSVLFMAVLYAVFVLLLRVQIPAGILV